MGFFEALRALVEAYPAWLAALLAAVGTLMVAAWVAGRWFQAEQLAVYKERLLQREDEINALKQRLGTGAAGVPGGLSSEQVELIRKVLAGQAGKVLLTYQGSSPMAAALAGQLEGIFDSCSWEVLGSQLLVEDDAGPNPERLWLASKAGARPEDYSTIKMAFRVAGVTFVEVPEVPAIVSMGWHSDDRPEVFVRGGLKVATV